MIHIKKIDEGFPIFKALASELRIEIVKMLMENRELSMNEIATRLGITNGALTSHVKLLENAGIVKIENVRIGHGNQKICKVAVDQILIDVESANDNQEEQTYNTEIQIGHYSDYKVYPTCGLATPEKLVGVVDDCRYFAHPDRINAEILWFTKGYIEYMVPNLLPDATVIDKITLSFEIGSEAPGYNNDWPSDIEFFINDIRLGMWTSAGDYGDVRGIFTPEWWVPNWNQYGLLKVLTIDMRGTFVDGVKISDVSINDLNLDNRSKIRFRYQVSEDAANVGGITLYGKGFGNYNQDIKVRISYKPVLRKRIQE
ncbi:MAG: winged helix-turn-helix transcriptional regulator [Agathobacter sp.]|nr:winged helix-turn-helix transcriptional regulator [Agathobacter sp.]